MRLLFDTNVTLDALLVRVPFAQDIQPLWQKAKDAEVIAYLTASAFTDIFYVARKELGKEAALQAMEVCLSIFEICMVDKDLLHQATTLPGADFEDNVQIACAERDKLEGIVTRDKADFKHSHVSVFTPAEALLTLTSSAN